MFSVRLARKIVCYLQRFALEDILEFNAESYFLARIRSLLKREVYCGILTMSDETPNNFQERQRRLSWTHQ